MKQIPKIRGDGSNMKKMRSIFAILLSAFFLTFATPAFAGNEHGNGPKKGEIWICPSVSPNNPNGMWVIGGHGAYYIIKPGTASPKWPMILNPTGNLEEHAEHVEDLAQVPAGRGLYHKLPSYPYLNTMEVGAMAVVLEDGVHFINDTFGIDLTLILLTNPYADDSRYARLSGMV